MHKKSLAMLVLGLLLSTVLPVGEGKGKGAKEKGNSETHKAADSDSSTIVDINIVLGEHRRIVSGYLDHYPKGGLPPGLAKRGGALPPGLEKQLHKNGRLPPGLRKRLAPYPADLTRRMPPLGEEYESGFLHGRVVIFNEKTSAILDVFIP